LPAVALPRYQRSPRHIHVRKQSRIVAESGEAALDVDPHASIILSISLGSSAAWSARARLHDDRRHLLANGRKLGRRPALELVGQFSDGALIAVEGFGMERDHVVGFLGLFKFRSKRFALRLQFIHSRDERVCRYALDDEIDNALDLALDLADPPFQPSVFDARLFLQPLALAVIDIDKFGDHLVK
jgi:hypothetical protein